MNNKQTLNVQIFGGPGAGKTTAAWMVASELKKRGYLVEYVPELAKRFVWRLDAPDRESRVAAERILDGTLASQTELYKNQMDELMVLQGQVDIVVTDSPALLGAVYLNAVEPSDMDTFVQQALSDFRSLNNFSLFVKRDEKNYENVGRIHTEKQAHSIDNKLIGFLNKHHIYYGVYTHDALDKVVVDNIESTYHKCAEKPDPLQVVYFDADRSVAQLANGTWIAIQ